MAPPSLLQISEGRGCLTTRIEVLTKEGHPSISPHTGGICQTHPSYTNLQEALTSSNLYLLHPMMRKPCCNGR